ncbi:BrnT family toxin [Roseospira navarrensis]|uniref:BrnT family toxin n=1 Tax=Roseospira navarrensis TaxID=140058 RepID=A0A7X2D3W3_9PROT|nr:BrnT family toxin [Roseospira navarrensis]MQX36022.1 BrnT family toxin [Roseospira navarrensis]
MDDRWTWDPIKAERNLAKHRVSFELAALVFQDPMQLTFDDPERSEMRFRTLGSVGGAVLVVAHTCPTETEPGRIISARRATPRERRMYHEKP